MREIIAKVPDSVYEDADRLRVRYKARDWAALLEMLILRDKGIKVV